MFKLREKEGAIYLDDGRSLYGFNGTPFQRHLADKDLPIVGQAPSVAAWQSDPAKYGPDYVVAQVYQPGQEPCWLGATWGFFVQWAAENDATISPNRRALFESAESARTSAQITQWAWDVVK